MNPRRSFLLTLIVFGFSLSQIYSQEENDIQSFHIGCAGISTTAFSTSEGQSCKSSNPLDFGFFCGNEFEISESFIFDLEFFYLNNRTEITRVDDQIFELNQNIGVLLKPGYRLSNHKLFIDLGMSAVYVFDKIDGTGNVIDRYDQAIMYGAGYDYSFSPNFSFQLTYLQANFHSISHWTNYELDSFSTISLAAIYHLD